MPKNPGDDALYRLLDQSTTIAVVGLSPKPHRDSHRVAKYLQEKGYKIIPVHPGAQEVLGEKAYPNLSQVPGNIDIVNVFRKSSDIPPVMEAAITKKPRAVWLQLGIENQEAAAMAKENNIMMVMNLCLMVEHQRLMSSCSSLAEPHGK